MLPIKGTFSDLKDMSEWPFPEIGLRITFRDAQTGQKHACYKVTSSISHMPEAWGDEVATSNPNDGPFWADEIYKKVIAAMKTHYDDGATDDRCDR